MDGQIGTMTPGSYADIIAVEGNPLEDLAAFLRVRHKGWVGGQARVRDSVTAIYGC